MIEEIRKAVEDFLEYAEPDEDVLAEFRKLLVGYFDELSDNSDYFGSEGQCYPFGDKRG